MNRIINSLAIAEYNRKLQAVEVNFNGAGLPVLYHETMDIAMNISLIYQTNQWLFHKKNFQDISPDNFLQFVKKWAEKATALYQEHAATDKIIVALYTTTDSCFYLQSENPWIQESLALLPNLKLGLFTDLDKAKTYLTKGKTPKVLM